MKLVFLYLSRRPNQYYKRKVVKHIVPNHSTTWLKSCSFPLDCCRLYCFTEKSAQPIIEHIFLFYWFIPLSRPPPLYCSSWTAISSMTIFFSSGNGLEKKLLNKNAKIIYWLKKCGTLCQTQAPCLELILTWFWFLSWNYKLT